MTRLRILTSMAGIPLLLLLAWLGGIAWAAALTAISLAGMMEFASGTSQGKSVRLPILLVSLLPLAGLLTSGSPGFFAPVALLSAFAAWLLFLVGWTVFHALLELPEDHACLMEKLQQWVGGAVWIPFFLSFGVLLRQHDYGWHWLFFSLLIAWSNDTFAYFGGLLLRGPKLARNISPNKTWSGALAGLLGSVTATSVWYPYTSAPQDYPLATMILMAILLAAAGQIGDLFESFWKRGRGLKDSGALIPGHGGVLDRFDSLLVIWPCLYLIVIWTERLS